MHLLSISKTILLFISGFGVLQGVLLYGLLYFHPKSDRSVNKFLALYIACLSIITAGPIIVRSIGWQHSFFMEPFTYLAGPLLYLYIRSFKETITWRKALPHVSLFFIYFFIAYYWVDSLAIKYPDAEQIPVEALNGPVALTHVLLRFGQLFLYYHLSRRQLSLYQRSVEQILSETNRINLQWGKWLINGYMIVIVSAAVLFGLIAKYPTSFDMLYLITIAIVSPYIYITTYRGLTQATIWQLKPVTNKVQAEDPVNKAGEIKILKTQLVRQKSTTHNFDTNKSNEIAAKIIRIMEEEKLYQETELTLQNLADKLQFPSYQVSQIINEGMNKSFYDLINGYRVEEAKRLLLDSKSNNYTILSVGFEAGFNSKTTFNTVFKKFTGYTPTAFRKSQREQAILN